VFSQPEGKAISDKYLAVRLLGGQDLDDEGKAFMARYGVGGYPTLLAMTADGAVLTKQFQRTADGIVEAMDGAAKSEASFKAKEAELAKKKDDASIRELAGLYFERFQLDQAREGLEALTASNPTVEDQLQLLEVLGSMNDMEARKALLGSLVKSRPNHADLVKWRIALATADVPTTFASREEYMAAMEQVKQALTELLGKVEKPADEAVVRVRLAAALNSSRDRESALEHWDWVLENARDSDAAADALMGKAEALFRAAQGDAKKLEVSQAMLQEIVDKHPSSPQASNAKRAIPAVQRAIDKAVADAAPAPDDESGGDDDGK